MKDTDIIWSLKFTITYNDRPTQELGLVKDDAGFRYVLGNANDFLIATSLPKFVNFMKNNGIILEANLPPNVTDYVFRFSAITSFNHVHFIGGCELNNYPITDDVTSVINDLLNISKDFNFHDIFIRDFIFILLTLTQFSTLNSIDKLKLY